MLEIDELVEVTHGVLFPLLGQVDDLADESSIHGGLLRGSVSISGESNAIVTVDCSEELATRIGAAMFDTDAEELTPEEVEDALGEIANIIGGNIKALLPGPSKLGLPQIDQRVTSRPPRTLVQRAFDCTGQPIVVCLASCEPIT